MIQKKALLLYFRMIVAKMEKELEDEVVEIRPN
jgi:hypothetical protein